MVKRSVVPICLFGCTLLAVLFFGLDPKGYDFSNHVSRIEGAPGIHFEKYGIASAPLDATLAKELGGEKGFSLFMVFQPKQLDNNGSGHILTIHPGNDSRQLVIWQWFSHVIAMNDDDALDSYRDREIFLTLAAGTEGTTLFLDGQPVDSSRSLRLQFPTGSGTTLVLGNSVYGDGPWRGTIAGLALFDRKLEAETVASMYGAWKQSGSLVSAREENPSILYLFNDAEAAPVRDEMNRNAPLAIPSLADPPRRKILARPLDGSGFTGSLAMDAFLNLAGFMPLGFFLGVVLLRAGKRPNQRHIIGIVLFCFAVSLLIEITQAWLPSRSSQILDLFLNTAGGCLGGLLSRSAIGRMAIFY
jgi:hypothetical protein